MEKLTQLTLLALVVWVVNAGVVLAYPSENADTYLSVHQIKNEKKKAVIRITDLPKDQHAYLRIKNQKGRVIHWEKIKRQQAFAKRYDFASLPGGEYTVELRTKEGILSETFELESGRTQPLYFKPAIQLEPDLIKIAFVNRKDTPVSVKLYDPGNRVIFEQKVPSQEQFSKGLNVSRLSPGLYSLAILGNDYVYSKSIQVK